MISISVLLARKSDLHRLPHDSGRSIEPREIFAADSRDPHADTCISRQLHALSAAGDPPLSSRLDGYIDDTVPP